MDQKSRRTEQSEPVEVGDWAAALRHNRDSSLTEPFGKRPGAVTDQEAFFSRFADVRG